MPAAVACHRLDYTFASNAAPALHAVSLQLAPGSWTLLSGRSGAGKSTLLLALAGLLKLDPPALRQGEIALGGRDPQFLPPAERAALVGLVQQSADAQICTTTVEAEVAFGLENLGLGPDVIDKRIQQALVDVGLADKRRNRIVELSGGQRQRLVLAAVLAMRPDVLLLDEPLSQLDPAAAAEFLAALDRLRDGGPTVLVAEHRTEVWRSRVDHVLCLEQGRVIEHREAPRAASLAVPKTAVSRTAAPPQAPSPALAVVERLTFRYGRNRALVLREVDFTLVAGECVALIGANGSGKSTLLALLCGWLQPSEGAIQFAAAKRSVGLVQQNPDELLFCRSVREELAFAPRRQRLREEEILARVNGAARQFDLVELLDRMPLLLSQGERLRVAIAAALTLCAPLLLLDEPTTGQDAECEWRIMHSLCEAVRAGGPPRTLLFSTHDLSVAREFADRVLVLDAGRLIADGPPEATINLFLRRIEKQVARGAT